MRAVPAAALLGIAFVAAALPAQAAFPGRNGHLAGTVTECEEYDVESPACLSWRDRVRLFRPGGKLVLEPRPARSTGPLSWSPDGRWAAVVLRFVKDWQDESEGPTPGIYVVPSSLFTRAGPAPSPPGALIVPRGDEGRAAWAPDGERLVVSDWRGPLVMDRSGRVLNQLPVPEGLSAGRTVWSATDRIAFSAQRFVRGRWRGGAIYTVRPDGSGLERLTHRPGYDLDWSPSGSRLAFQRAGRILVVRAGGGARRLVAGHGGTPVWSPDGRWIAFTRQVRGACRGQAGYLVVFIVRASGGEARPVRVGERRRRVCVDHLSGWQPLP
jgi:TolB protein